MCKDSVDIAICYAITHWEQISVPEKFPDSIRDSALIIIIITQLHLFIYLYRERDILFIPYMGI